MVRWLRAMNGAMVSLGLATVSTPTMRSVPSRSSTIGAATYITVEFSSSGSARVERAP